jgi:FkbM family methyltransferase
MFFTFKDCKDNNNINFKNILHIGAHYGEEIEEYSSCGVKSVCWFEANSNFLEKLKENTKNYTHIQQQYYFDALSDVHGEEVHFNVTNNGQSSSLLEFGTHLQYCPNIQVVDKIQLKTKRLDSFIDEINFSKFDFLTLDVQGAELKVLKGFGDILNIYKNIKGIYTEINFEQVYVGAAHFDELDKYLKSFGFERNRYYKFDAAPWGDAFYYRN